MQIKDEIFEILRTNYWLRKAISDNVDSRPVNVERWAKRKSIPSWFEKDVIKVIIRETNLTDKEIYQ